MNTPQYEKLSYRRLMILLQEEDIGHYFKHYKTISFEDDVAEYEIGHLYSERIGDDTTHHLTLKKRPLRFDDLNDEFEYLEVSVNPATEMVTPSYYTNHSEELEAFDSTGRQSADYDDLLAYSYNLLQGFVDFQNQLGRPLVEPIQDGQAPRLPSLGAIYA